MKILVCIGSYRKNGNTDQLVRLIQGHLEQEAQGQQVPLEIETVYLGREEIGACRGCRVCFDKGEERCPLKDDLLGIKAKMQAADGLLVASPVYVDDVSGITKNWIDRLAHVCHRPEFAGKSAYLIATVGSSPCDHTLRTLMLALGTWGFHIVGQSGFKTGAAMPPAELQQRFARDTERIACKFFKSLHQRTFANPSFLSLMMFKIQQTAWQKKGDKTSYDYAYWNGKGWLDPRQNFYIPNTANPLKVAAARLTGSVISHFVS
jgi:multimeric flavodoxin WrbA